MKKFQINIPSKILEHRNASVCSNRAIFHSYHSQMVSFEEHFYI